MKRISDVLLKYLKNYYLVSSLIIGVLATANSSTFSLNPFVLLALFLASRSGIIPLLLTSIMMISTALLKSLFYGVEIGLAVSLYVALVNLPNPLKRSKIAFLPPILFFLILSPFYLLPNIDLTLLYKIIENFLVTFLFYYCVYTVEKKELHSSYLPAASLAFLPKLFEFNPLLMLIAIFFFSLIYLLQIESKERRFTYLFFLVISLYSFIKLPLEQIFFILPSLLIVALFPAKRFQIPSFILLALLPPIILHPESFFRQETFLAPLISLLIFSTLFTYKPQKSLVTFTPIKPPLQEKIKDISEYLDLITAKKIDSALSDESLEANLRLPSCPRCQNYKECPFIQKLSKNLPKPIFTSYKEEIRKGCPSSGKLIYRYGVIKSLVEKELMHQSAKEGEQNALLSVIAPLKTLVKEDVETPLDEVGLNILISSSKIEKYYLDHLLTNAQLEKKEILKMEERIGMKILEDYHYDLLTHRFSYRFVQKRSYHFHADAISLPLSPKGGGDIFYENNTSSTKYEFVLFDAMGHEESTKEYAKLALRIFNLSPTRGESEKRIKEINSVLRYQTLNENYATMDLVELDKIDGAITLYKLGSAMSFIIDPNLNVTRIENSTLPLGIIEDLFVPPIPLTLFPGSKLLLLTDGFEGIDEEFLIGFLKTKKLKSDLLVNAYLEKFKQKDDATLAILSLSLLEYDHA